MHSWHGMATLSERFAAKGSDSQDRGEGAGDAYWDFAFDIFRHSLGSRDTGKGGGCFTGCTYLKTDWADDEGGVKIAH